jgi:hypothetical protein
MGSCFDLASRGRGFLPGNRPVSDQFLVGASVAHTRVTAGKSGEFAVAGADSDLYGSTHGQRHALDGTPQGRTLPLDGADEIIRLTSGDLVVVWRVNSIDSQMLSRRYSADLTPLTPAVLLAQADNSWFGPPRVAAGFDDDFLVVWEQRESNPLGEDHDVFARWVGPTGELSGVVMVTTSGRARYPSVASRLDGDFLVVWSNGSSEEEEVRGRAVRQPVLFSDGFESGDTSAWSNTVP